HTTEDACVLPLLSVLVGRLSNALQIKPMRAERLHVPAGMSERRIRIPRTSPLYCERYARMGESLDSGRADSGVEQTPSRARQLPRNRGDRRRHRQSTEGAGCRATTCIPRGSLLGCEPPVAGKYGGWCCERV